MEIDPLQVGELVIHVSNDWYERLQRPELAPVTADYTLRRDDSLQPGSVRLAIQDTSIDDLIEHRLAELGQQVFSNTTPAPEGSEEQILARSEGDAAEGEADDLSEVDEHGAIIQGDYSEVDDIFFQRPEDE
jgi:hypothetical protein